MKTLRQLCAALVLTLALALTAVAADGHIDCGFADTSLDGHIDCGLVIAESLIASVLSLV
ncbi:MAG: hypothetical protein WCF57_16135 [Pyrinomonadaceae bacterium]